MKKLSVLALCLVIIFTLGGVVSAQDPTREVDLAREKMVDITTSMGTQNRTPGTDGFEAVQTVNLDVPVAYSCDPVPDIQKDPALVLDFGPETVVFKVAAHYCEATSILTVKGASPLTNFITPHNTLRVYGFYVPYAQDGALLGSPATFDHSYMPTSFSTPIQFGAEFAIPFDGKPDRLHVEVSTKQVECNNGGSAVGDGWFTAGNGSLRIKTFAGCTRAVMIEVAQKMKDGTWVVIHNEPMTTGTIDIGSEVPEGEYRVIATFRDGTVFTEYRTVSVETPDHVITIPGQGGVCFPLLLQSRQLDCPVKGLVTSLNDPDGYTNSVGLAKDGFEIDTSKYIYFHYNVDRLYVYFVNDLANLNQRACLPAGSTAKLYDEASGVLSYDYTGSGLCGFSILSSHFHPDPIAYFRLEVFELYATNPDRYCGAGVRIYDPAGAVTQYIVQRDGGDFDSLYTQLSLEFESLISMGLTQEAAMKQLMEENDIPADAPFINVGVDSTPFTSFDQ